MFLKNLVLNKNKFYKLAITSLIIKSIFPGFIPSILVILFFNLSLKVFSEKKYIFWLGIISLLVNIYSDFILKKNRDYDFYPQNNYSLKDRYKSNLEFNIKNKHGDLCQIGNYLPADKNCTFWSGQRVSNFKTNELGYVGEYSLKESNHLIVGDSFLALHGGASIKNSLGSLLSNSDKKYFQAAYPGAIKDYLKRIKEIDNFTYPRLLPITLLIFEGDDLVIFKENMLNYSLQEFISSLKSYQISPSNRLIYSIYKKYLNKKNNNKIVETIKINGKSVGFLRNYIKNSQNENLGLPPLLEKFKKISATRKICIIFVPTKWASYFSNESIIQRHPILDKQISYLESSGIDVIDLSSSFQSYTKNMYPNNSNLFWEDDSHWSDQGIIEASRNIKNSSKCFF